MSLISSLFTHRMHMQYPKTWYLNCQASSYTNPQASRYGKSAMRPWRKLSNTKYFVWTRRIKIFANSSKICMSSQHKVPHEGCFAEWPVREQRGLWWCCSMCHHVWYNREFAHAPNCVGALRTSYSVFPLICAESTDSDDSSRSYVPLCWNLL